MTRPVFHTGEATPFPGGSERFGAEVLPFGQDPGSGGLGALLLVVPPGKRAMPFHNHLGNDEVFVILEGEAIYRFGDAEYPVRAGSVCGAPRGGPDRAHQLINSGVNALKYIGISTLLDPGVVEYPDSGKFGALAIAPGDSFTAAHLKVLGRRGESLDYRDGEET